MTNRQVEPAVIRITRQSAFTFSARKFKIFLDNIQVQWISNRGVVDLPTTPGRHEVYVAVDFYRSQPVVVDLRPGETSQLECGPGNFVDFFTPNGVYLRLSGLVNPRGPGQPRISTLHVQDVLERVPAGEEDVRVSAGVVVRVSRSRTLERSLEIDWQITGSAELGGGVKEILWGSIQAEVSRRQGKVFRESETVEYEIELKGDQASVYHLTWMDFWRHGVAEVEQGDGNRRSIPFKFRERTELVVTPV